MEFALVMPVLLLLVFGMIDFGRMWNMQIALTHAAREGVRVLALGGTEADATTRVQDAATPVTGMTITPVACPAVVTATSDAQITATRQYDYITPVGALAGIFGSTLDAPLITGQGRMRCHG